MKFLIVKEVHLIFTKFSKCTKLCISNSDLFIMFVLIQFVVAVGSVFRILAYKRGA